MEYYFGYFSAKTDCSTKTTKKRHNHSCLFVKIVFCFIQIKITIRFLSNEIRSDSLKIIVHRKICKNATSGCQVSLMNNTKISEELRTTIIKKASLIEKESKNKKN